jgi:hypothetical protein
MKMKMKGFRMSMQNSNFWMSQTNERAAVAVTRQFRGWAKGQGKIVDVDAIVRDGPQTDLALKSARDTIIFGRSMAACCLLCNGHHLLAHLAFSHVFRSFQA